MKIYLHGFVVPTLVYKLRIVNKHFTIQKYKWNII